MLFLFIYPVIGFLIYVIFFRRTTEEASKVYESLVTRYIFVLIVIFSCSFTWPLLFFNYLWCKANDIPF